MRARHSRRHQWIVGVEHRRVAVLLAQEDALLGARVCREAPVAVEVIGRDVEQRRGARPEVVDPFELKARQLDDEDTPGRAVDAGDERRADIAADLDLAPGGAEQRAGERRRGALAVRARDRDHRTVQERERQLDLGEHREARGARQDEQRPRGRHARTGHHRVDARRQDFGHRAGAELETRRGREISEIEALGGPLVDSDDRDSPRQEKARRGASGEAHAVDQHATEAARAPRNGKGHLRTFRTHLIAA